MTDIAMVSSLLAAIDTAINFAKSIKESVHSLKKAELNLMIVDLIETQASQKLLAADLKIAILEKEQEIRKLNGQLAYLNSQNKPQFIHGRYKFEGDDGVYCCRCWDADLKKFHVVTKQYGPRVDYCVECKTQYSV